MKTKKYNLMMMNKIEYKNIQIFLITLHKITVISSPPIETKYLSSAENLIYITGEECPLLIIGSDFLLIHGYLK